MSPDPDDGVGLRARQPQAVRNAFAVLEEVARCGAGVTGTEVARHLGMPKATAYRLLNMLVEDEYLVRVPDLSGFALGRKVAWLVALTADADRQTSRSGR
ncbi:helix-turn-helix domain-containing protein [Raineyella fluvialis]|uniref:Helix-turn-helix domain-containing protein n=1 Tax=Raineyella fluvialis TaxID=2662261 RepID=A0A5Q2F9J0_9ACTN|nr:helix-turn-helix domain-containing protein [Raineyella fluvialis]QGF23051.1 helix-turn-helix domain-containing protein [Raineyella fluvialis]